MPVFFQKILKHSTRSKVKKAAESKLCLKNKKCAISFCPKDNATIFKYVSEKESDNLEKQPGTTKV